MPSHARRPSMPSFDPPILWLMVGLLLVTFWLGARGIDVDPIWLDEFHSIQDAHGLNGGPMAEPRDPVEVWQGVARRNPWHAPGLFILLNAWGRFAGWDPPVLRLFSLFIGVLAVPVTYRLGSEFVARRVGWYAAVVLGTSVLFVYYLHEVRMYSLIVLLTVVNLWQYLRIVRSPREPGRRAWLLFFISLVVTLYVHYLAAIPLVAVGLYHLLFVKKDRRWWRVVALALLAGVLFLPWAQVFIEGLGRTAASESLPARALDTGTLLERALYYFSNGGLWLLAVILPLVGLALWKRPAIRRNGVAFGFMALALLAIFIALNLALHLVPLQRLRYLLSLWPLLALLVAVAVWELRRRWGIAGPAFLMAWAAYGIGNSAAIGFVGPLSQSFTAFPLHWTAREVQGRAQTDDLLLMYLNRDQTPASPRYDRTGPYYLDSLNTNYDYVRLLNDATLWANLAREASDQVAQRQRLWMAYTPPVEPSAIDVIRTALDDQYTYCESSLQSPALAVIQYTHSPVCCLPESTALLRPTLRFGDAISLVQSEPLPATAGGELSVTLLWSLGADVPRDTYSVTLQLLDGDGTKVTQADYGLEALAYTCQTATVPLAGVTPGDYTLTVGVYAWQRGERLRGSVVASGAEGELLPLGAVRVGGAA